MTARRLLVPFGVMLSIGLPTSAYTAPNNMSPGAANRVSGLQTVAQFDLRAPGLQRMGGDGARFVLIEFSDYGCAHCAMFHELVFPKIKREYIDTGRLGYVAMHSPRNGQQGSWLAAEAACAAGEQGRFWEMRDLLFANFRSLSREIVDSLAGRLGLDLQQYRGSLESGAYLKDIEREKHCGASLGVTGTPSFILASVENGVAVEGQLHVGVIRWSTFKKRMDALLQAPGAGSTGTGGAR